MERVQFEQEQMLDELKDLVEKHLFTKKEIKEIMSRRRGFETALVRRVPLKSDFLRYIQYEMGLEVLRRKRVERMKTDTTTTRSISDYALVRRQFHIFERAVKKFKSDVSMWVEYISVAKREGASALVGRITARALQLHPNEPGLYILAASHELAHGSDSGARTLLQRGIRLNEESINLWKEYVKMEMGFIEKMRRRWSVLGIKKEEKDEVMEGGIVKQVITSAAQAIPKVELFEAVKSAIEEYPLEKRVKREVLKHVHDLWITKDAVGRRKLAKLIVSLCDDDDETVDPNLA